MKSTAREEKARAWEVIHTAKSAESKLKAQLDFLAAEQSRLAEAKAEREQQELLVAQREREAKEMFLKAERARREARDRMRQAKGVTRATHPDS